MVHVFSGEPQWRRCCRCWQNHVFSYCKEWGNIVLQLVFPFSVLFLYDQVLHKLYFSKWLKVTRNCFIINNKAECYENVFAAFLIFILSPLNPLNYYWMYLYYTKITHVNTNCCLHMQKQQIKKGANTYVSNCHICLFYCLCIGLSRNDGGSWRVFCKIQKLVSFIVQLWWNKTLHYKQMPRDIDYSETRKTRWKQMFWKKNILQQWFNFSSMNLLILKIQAPSNI